MRIRWPLVRRSELEAALAEIAALAEVIDDQADEIHDCHEHIARLDAEIARLTREAADALADAANWRAAAARRDLDIARLRAASIPLAEPFWLGLPNEVLSLIVTTNADGAQATIGGLGYDEESNDPRVNPGLPFALRPL